MTKLPSLAGIAVMVVIGTICYGVGTGWIRVGTPHPSGAAAEDHDRMRKVENSATSNEPTSAAARSPALRDHAVMQADAASAPDLFTAAASLVGVAAPGSVTTAVQKAVSEARKAITDELFAPETDISKKIDEQAQFIENYTDAKTKMTTSATEAAKTAAEAKLKPIAEKAANDANNPAPKEQTDLDKAAADALTVDVKNAAKKAATDAAIAAIASVYRDQLKDRKELVDGDDVKLAYHVGTDVAIPANGNLFKSDGPALTIAATITVFHKSTANKDERKFNDSGSNLKVELISTDAATKPYLTITPGEAQAVTEATKELIVTAVEAGKYNIVVTVSPKDRDPLVFTKAIEIQPNAPSVQPKITKLDETQGDRRIHFELAGSAPVELRTGHMFLAGTIGRTNVTLIAVNADSDTAIKEPDGRTPRADAVASGQEVTIPVTIAPEDLTDTPTRLELVDLWTHQKSDAITVVIPGGSGGLPLETPGIRATTGKNAIFKEYTDPRQLPDGFKPSDHVETRVVRLYYYRDAHRVAQIVNREVKSFNRVAVDTRRRMAEKARDEADVSTDKRRLQEIRSVRDAQAARAAEAKMRQAQGDLDRALKSEQQARDDAPIIDAKLKDSDTNVTQLNAQVETLQGQLTTANARDPKDPSEIARLTGALVAARNQRNQFVANQSALNQQKTDAQATISGQKSSDLKKAVDTARTELEKLRNTEATSSDARVEDEQHEDRARENQFRQEVAAAHEDPDTYVAGNPYSPDPVLQVSVSVIGEGLIQLRGPIKGINVIRTMINQIDAPTSQVRVGIHTVQINGEHGDRMEKVATRIQDYIDHARFLTVQSSQLLRNAVVKIASNKAHEAIQLCPNAANHQQGVHCPQDTQQARDARYQEAFFGADFISELRAIDSEFLMTGNKLLSLHSMDTTSLASALFLMALAKNDIRMEILTEFQRAIQVDLPQAEQTYYDAGAVGRPKDHFQHFHHDDFKQFAGNAKFQSFMGFFDAQVAGTETLNPLQREFLKLAQIFKSRLVTELEYNQRIKERGLIEDRIDPILDRKKAREDEERARSDLVAAFKTILDQRDNVFVALSETQAKIGEIEKQVNDTIGQLRRSLTVPRIDASGKWQAVKERVSNELANNNPFLQLKLKINREALLYTAPSKDRAKPMALKDGDRSPANDADDPSTKLFQRIVKSEDKAVRTLFRVRFVDYSDFDALRSTETSVTKLMQVGGIPSFDQWVELYCNAIILERVAMGARRSFKEIDRTGEKLVSEIGSTKPDGRKLFASWLILKHQIEATIRQEEDSGNNSALPFADLDAGFKAVLQATLKYEAAVKNAELTRRPLDHKRLLDMLIDDVEEKYIELLEGTRSHTANIDAYIKSIATALDDDFNTQFYYPAFTEVRQASRFHDVNFGKIETTNVLANNRGFAKVEPQATMEFDLPKRDILINEALNGALAMTKDFGALANDPTFLSMAKLRSGQPTSSLAPGAGEGVNTVRNALPGLSRSDDEKLFSQQGAGRAQFGSAMEALIPDPAVYKFETGTGFEIRPVVQPDGQSLVFHFFYMYTTNIREPVRADEKHLGRVKRHFIDTDVQLGNYELREISRYQVALKASRTSRGVPLFEDIPLVGILFRPLPSAESSLQENIVLGQSTIFPTLFDLMGLRWAPAVADLDTLRLRNDNFVVRGRNREVQNRVFDISSGKVDEFLQIPNAERRPDLYRTQQTIPDVHPDGYRGSGLNYQNSRLREGYNPAQVNPERGYISSESRFANPASPPADSTPPGMNDNPQATTPDPAVTAPAGTRLQGAPAGPSSGARYPGGTSLPMRAAPPGAIRGTGATPSTSGSNPANLGPATSSRATSRLAPPARGSVRGVVDESVARSSYTVTGGASARRAIAPPVKRQWAPTNSKGQETLPRKQPAATPPGAVDREESKNTSAGRQSSLSPIRRTAE